MADRLRWGLVWAARIGAAITFYGAALPKVIDLPGFSTDIQNFQAFPYWSANMLAAWVPMLEIVGVTAFLIGWKRRAAAWLLALLDFAFIILITWVLAAGIDVACGCFGHDDQAASIGWPQLGRDVLLLAAIVIGAWDAGRPPWTPRPTSSPSTTSSTTTSN